MPALGHKLAEAQVATVCTENPRTAFCCFIVHFLVHRVVFQQWLELFVRILDFYGVNRVVVEVDVEKGCFWSPAQVRSNLLIPSLETFLCLIEHFLAKLRFCFFVPSLSILLNSLFELAVFVHAPNLLVRYCMDAHILANDKVTLVSGDIRQVNAQRRDWNE